MTETIPNTDIPLVHNKLKWFEVTPKRLLLVRKWLMIVAALTAVTAVISLYANGLTVRGLFDIVLTFACISMTAKCETLYLKMKIEEALETKV